MDSKTIRDQFEQWASGQFSMPLDVVVACRYEETYANTVLNIAWLGWARSAAPLVKELESHKRMLLAAACDIGAIGKALGADMDDDGITIEGLAQELSKDAERLDFLESLARSSHTGASIVKGERKKSLEVMWFHKRAGAKPNLREAIDAAVEVFAAQEKH